MNYRRFVRNVALLLLFACSSESAGILLLSTGTTAPDEGGGDPGDPGDDRGISEYLIQTLVTGTDGLTVFGNSEIIDIDWSDDDGGFVRLTWSDAGSAGLRYRVNESTKQVYISYEIRRHSAYFSKQLKVNDRSVGPGCDCSNMTFGPSFSGGLNSQITAWGINYGDGISGSNDNQIANDIEGYDPGDPFTRDPPRNRVVSDMDDWRQDVTGTVWHLVEIFVKFNDPDTPNGEVAVWFEGELVLWEDLMYNSTNLNGYPRDIGIGEVSYRAGLVEDYRDFRVSLERPVGRGID